MKNTILSIIIMLLTVVGASGQSITDNDYLIKNVETGKFLVGANNWGTQASLLDYGQKFTVRVLSNGKYTLDSHAYNSSNAHYLGANGYVDCNVEEAYLVPVDSTDRTVRITFDNEKYFAAASGTNIVNPNASASDSGTLWQFIPFNEAVASIKSGDNVSFLIKAPDFSRNHYSQASGETAWVTDFGTVNMGGANDNYCVESWKSDFNFYQEITGIPNGKYILTAQAVATEYEVLGYNLPFIYANEATTPFNISSVSGAMDNGENTMSAMSASFSQGLYNVKPIEVQVTDGTLTIGVRGTRTDMWCIWDNFQLYYDKMSDTTSTPDVKPLIPADAIASGETGTCIWYITSDSCLVIAPADGVSGDLPSWGYDNFAPWREYANDITTAKIESGVNTTSCSYLFYKLSKMKSIDLSNFNTQNVTDMSGIFYGCSSLTSLDLSNFNTENVTSMHSMFFDCSSLTSLDLSNFNTENVTGMSWMFSGCSSLTSLDLSNFNTQNVTGIWDMFYGCSALNTIISDNETPSPLKAGTFESFEKRDSCTLVVPSGSEALYAAADGWNELGNIVDELNNDSTDMPVAVALVNYEEEIALSGNAAVSAAVANALKVEIKDLPDAIGFTYLINKMNINEDEEGVFWSLGQEISSGEHLFNDTENKELEIPVYFAQGGKYQVTVAIIGGTLSAPTEIGTYTYEVNGTYSEQLVLTYIKNEKGVTAINEHSSVSVEAADAIVVNAINLPEAAGITYSIKEMVLYREADSENWAVGKEIANGEAYLDEIANATLDSTLYLTEGNKYQVSVTVYDKSGVAAASYIYEVNGSFDETPEYLAQGETGTCIWYITQEGELVIAPADGVSGDLPEEGWSQTYDSENWHLVVTPWYDYKESITSAKIMPGVNAKSCSSMFYGLSEMKTVDLSSFNIENATSMTDMFLGCSSLTSLNLNNYNTSNVTNMSHMFASCSSLTTLNLSGFNTQNVTDMSSMFDGCSALTQIDLSSFNTENMIDMSSMFEDCSALTSLDLSNFNTQNVVNMKMMFERCSALISLNLSGFDIEEETITSRMFYNCSALSLIISNNETPSPLKAGTFESFENRANCTLLVPAGAKALYAIADGWNELGNIIELPAENDSYGKLILALTSDSAFYNSADYVADEVTYTREFTKETEIGGSAGWETIVLPFDVDEATTEDGRVIAPFGSTDANYGGASPYWLAELTTEGFTHATKIRANIPYIICMPNNPGYGRNNITGKVTFRSKKIMVRKSDDTKSSVSADYTLVPTYDFVEPSPSIYAINHETQLLDGSEYAPGSIFLSNGGIVKPFEAYITLKDLPARPRFIPIFNSEADGITDVTANKKSYMVNGTCHNLQGQRVNANAKGILIVGGKKLLR